MKPRLVSGARIRKEADGYLLVTPGGRLIMLNQTGFEIVKLCNGQLSVDEIVSWIWRQYPEVTREEVRQDVEEFLQDLSRAGTIDDVENTD